MVKWLLIAALATIGVTSLLIGVMYRANRSTLERTKQGRDDGAAVPIVADAGSSRHVDSDAADGGGDGGGGGGD